MRSYWPRAVVSRTPFTRKQVDESLVSLVPQNGLAAVFLSAGGNTDPVDRRVLGDYHCLVAVSGADCRACGLSTRRELPDHLRARAGGLDVDVCLRHHGRVKRDISHLENEGLPTVDLKNKLSEMDGKIDDLCESALSQPERPEALRGRRASKIKKLRLVQMKEKDSERACKIAAEIESIDKKIEVSCVVCC